MTDTAQPTIALLPWGDTWEDFFHTIDITIESFCNELTGGWQFGFVESLNSAGIRTIIIYPTTLVQEPKRLIHNPTGATICMLPVPRIYRAIRRRMIHPYPSLAYWDTFEDLFGNVGRIQKPFLRAVRHLASYLSTPMRQLMAELKRENCSAIFCQEYEYSRFDLCILIGRILRLPVFATFQGGTSDCNRIGRFLRPFTLPRATGLAIGPEAEVQRVLKSYSIEAFKISKIFNPITLDTWNPIGRDEARKIFGIPENAEVVVWHGRLDIHNKGMDVLLEAWKEVCETLKDHTLHLALLGSAEGAQEFHSLLTKSGMQNVSWIDRYVNDRKLMRDFLCTGDVYVFPSRWEGFPVAPLEAMACGLPVVAADASGVSDIFQNGEKSGGIVVPRGSSEALANGLCRLLQDSSLRKEMGRCSRNRVEEAFTTEIIGKQLKEMFLRSNP